MASRRPGRPKSAAGAKKVRTYVDLDAEVDAELQRMATEDQRPKASMARKIFMKGFEIMKKEKP